MKVRKRLDRPILHRCVAADGSLIPRFRRARRDPELAVLEGFHALKHALRFDAPLLEVVVSDEASLERLAGALAPDLSARLRALAQPVEPAVFAQLAPLPPPTGVIALAERRAGDPAAGARRPARGAGDPARGPARPRQHGRLRARRRRGRRRRRAHHRQPRPLASRRAARRGGAALRAAGRPARPSSLAELDRPLLAIDPEGEPLDPAALPARAVLAFGTERYGLSDELTARADARISIPMRAGVSSLNLATSVAAVLFAWRLCQTSA